MQKCFFAQNYVHFYFFTTIKTWLICKYEPQAYSTFNLTVLHIINDTEDYFLLFINFQVCNNEATCTCDATWAGTDCSMHDPPKEPPVMEDPGPKGS